ncbi:TPA: P2 family phage major capsid protein [Yersinia enterocolitica]
MLTPNAARLTRQYIDELRKAFSDCEADTDNKSFTLSEPRSIALRKALMERLEFLGMITMLDVPHPQGQVVNIGESTLRTGRVKSGRFTKGSTFSGNTFQLVETDSCNVIPWETLAIWANAGSPQEFFNLMNSAALHNFGEDIALRAEPARHQTRRTTATTACRGVSARHHRGKLAPRDRPADKRKLGTTSYHQ